MWARNLLNLFRHPRTLVDTLLTYPRFIGCIKPSLLDVSEQELVSRIGMLQNAWWPAKLEAPLGRRILAVSAHPDDETIGAGGLLIAHRLRAEISVITVFNGEDGGQLEESRTNAQRQEQLVDVRRRELLEACSHFGGKLIGSLGLRDGSTPSCIATEAERLRRLVLLVKPDVVVMPWFLDRNSDHRITNLLWATGCRDLRCIVLASEIWSPIPHPNAYFDMTDFWEAKMAAISVFKTQLATVDYVSLALGLGKMRAFFGRLRQRRTGMAEAYLSLPNRDYCDLVLRTHAIRSLPDEEAPAVRLAENGLRATEPQRA